MATPKVTKSKKVVKHVIAMDEPQGAEKQLVLDVHGAGKGKGKGKGNTNSPPGKPEKATARAGPNDLTKVRPPPPGCAQGSDMAKP